MTTCMDTLRHTIGFFGVLSKPHHLATAPARILVVAVLVVCCYSTQVLYVCVLCLVNGVHKHTHTHTTQSWSTGRSKARAQDFSHSFKCVRAMARARVVVIKRKQFESCEYMLNPRFIVKWARKTCRNCTMRDSSFVGWAQCNLHKKPCKIYAIFMRFTMQQIHQHDATTIITFDFDIIVV